MAVATPTTVEEFTRELEARENVLQLEYYNQYAGFGVNQEVMRKVALEIQDLNRRALERFPQDEVPGLLFHAMVRGAEASAFTDLENRLYEMRSEAVEVEDEGTRVNLNNVRVYNFNHLRDPARRKRVFDALMEEARKLTPVLKERFGLSARVHGEHGLTPLDVYCTAERISPEKLEAVVSDAAERAKPEFQRLAEEIAPEVIGKKMEYFDDMYVFRHAIYAPIDASFEGVDFVGGMKDVARKLGFSVDEVGIDGEVRAGKYASPVCFGIKIPGDVRVLYQETSPFGDYESFYHEMGHGVHFVSVRADEPYWDRYLIPNGIAEIFSTLFEEMALDPAYLAEDMGLPEDVIEEVHRRRRFMDLYFLTFYGANALLKTRFWKEELWRDPEEANPVYEDLTERFMGVRYPGRYWQTHHITSMSDLYAPSYLLANIRKSELRRELERRYGSRWWREPDAGAFLRDECMGPGAALDLDTFSRLDADAYVKRVVEA